MLEYFLIFTIAVLIIWQVIRNAEKLGLVDIPNQRSVHKHETPRGAGIGIYLAVAVVYPFFHFTIFTEYFLCFIAILLVFIIGVLDDHRDAPPKAKFIVIGIATVLLFVDGIQFTTFKEFLGVEVTLGLLALPFMLFATAGFANAFNLIDGLDGLSGTIGLIIFSFFFYIGHQHEDIFITSISGGYIAALIAFLCFNWNPARIFMGDSGSLAIGFVIALLSIKIAPYIQPVAILYIAALPIFDTLIVMIRRKLAGQGMFSPDKTHIHHLTLKFFQYDVKKSVLFLGSIQLIYAMIGLSISKHTEQTFTLALFFLNLFVLYLALGAFLKRQELFEVSVVKSSESDTDE